MDNDKNKDKKDEKIHKKGPGLFDTIRRQRKMKQANNFRQGFGNLLSFIFIAILVLFLLSGFINQLETGQNIVQWGVGISKHISDYITKTITGKGLIEQTKTGIYFKK